MCTIWSQICYLLNSFCVSVIMFLTIDNYSISSIKLRRLNDEGNINRYDVGLGSIATILLC